MTKTTIRTDSAIQERLFRWGLIALASGAGIASLWSLRPSFSVVRETDSSLLPAPETLPPLESGQVPESLAESATGAAAEISTLGIAYSYAQDGVQITRSDIDINRTQAEQGLDDGSGLTYPCVFGGDPDVCQRRLTPKEQSALNK